MESYRKIHIHTCQGCAGEYGTDHDRRFEWWYPPADARHESPKKRGEWEFVITLHPRGLNFKFELVAAGGGAPEVLAAGGGALELVAVGGGAP